MNHKCDGCRYKGEHQEMMFRPFGVCTMTTNLIEAERYYNAEKCPYGVSEADKYEVSEANKDDRRLYIKQLLRNYKQSNSPNMYTVNYQLYDDKGQQYKFFGHNDGIEFVIDYIEELENKIDKLQIVERIINVARSISDGIR